MAADRPAAAPAARRRLGLLLPGPRRSPLGFLVSVLLHVAVLLFVVAPLSSGLSRLFLPGDTLTWRAAGGGGGGGLAYISLPAPRAQADAARTRAPAPPRQAAPAQPPPVVSDVPAPAPAPEPESTIPVSGGAAGDSATGTGPGQGGGTGGGTGLGTGPGTGPGTGGGDVGRLVAPVPRRMVIPPQDPPRALRGREVRVTFAVDAEGRVTRVSIEPEIQDREYRERLLDAMRNYRFTPARGPDGAPVAGTYVVTVTL